MLALPGQTRVGNNKRFSRSSSLFKLAYLVAALQYLIFATMPVHFPDTVRKARDEFDTVVGRDRATTFSDAGDLPHIQAMGPGERAASVEACHPVSYYSLPCVLGAGTSMAISSMCVPCFIQSFQRPCVLSRLLQFPSWAILG